MPPSPSSRAAISGMTTRSTSVEASAAWQATKPECRPITFTSPMPLWAPVASTRAARMTSTAAENALSNPKLRSMKWMSLSMVLGTPTTAILSPRRAISAVSCMAPRMVPSPPTTNSTSMPERLEVVDDLARVLRAARRAEDGAALVVDVRHRLGREDHGVVAEAGQQPLEPVAQPQDVADPVAMRQLEHQPAHDVVEPRAQPAAGDDPGPQRPGIEEDLVARPRQLERRQRPELPRVGPQARQAIVDQHLVRLAHEVHRVLTEVRRHRRSQPALAQVPDRDILHPDPPQPPRAPVRASRSRRRRLGPARRSTRHRVNHGPELGLRFSFYSPSHENVRPDCDPTPPTFPPPFQLRKSP